MNVCRRARRGFTLTEMMVVTGLTVLLTTILSTVWASFCAPTVDVLGRCRIAQEADFALASLSRDLSGSLANPEGRLGGTDDYKWVGRQTPESTSLRLCFHAPDSTDMTPQWASPDTVISYSVDSGQLFRHDETAGTSIVVAELLTNFQVVPLDSGDGVTITMTFGSRGMSMTYSIVALDPPT